MHTEKVSGMSQKGSFIMNTKGIYFLGIFLDVNFFKYFKCQPN